MQHDHKVVVFTGRRLHDLHLGARVGSHHRGQVPAQVGRAGGLGQRVRRPHLLPHLRHRVGRGHLHRLPPLPARAEAAPGQ